MTIGLQFLLLLMICYLQCYKEAVLAEWGSETRPVNKRLLSLYGQLRQVDATSVYTVLGIYSKCFIFPFKTSSQGARCEGAANSPNPLISAKTPHFTY